MAHKVIGNRRLIRVVTPDTASVGWWGDEIGWASRIQCESCKSIVERGVALPHTDGESYICVVCLRDALSRLETSLVHEGARRTDDPF